MKLQNRRLVFSLLRGIGIAIVLVFLSGAIIVAIMTAVVWAVVDTPRAFIYVLLVFPTLILLQTGFLYIIHRTTRLTRSQNHDDLAAQ